MSLFDFGTRSDARFGEGVRHELAATLPDDGSAQILVVGSDSALARAPLPDLIDALRARGTVHIWGQVMPNPRVEDIDACFDAHRAHGITHVVGIGGGSAVDQAKATAMALSCDSSVRDLLAKGGTLPARTNTLVLIPTTSGTGAELSYGAILTDASTGQKLGLRGAAQAANLALVDPELTYSVPMETSMVTGFDVLTHALETYISSAATLYTADLSRSAIERVFRWLPALAADLNDKVARRELAYASMLMGHTLALSTTCLPHRLQYPIGAATDTAHAAGLAAIYPAWMAHLLPHATEKLSHCADWIGAAPAEATPEEKAAAFVAAVEGLLAEIKLQPTLQDLGVDAEMVARFPDEVNGKMDTDPCYTGRDALVTIYNNAFGL